MNDIQVSTKLFKQYLECEKACYLASRVGTGAPTEEEVYRLAEANRVKEMAQDILWPTAVQATHSERLLNENTLINCVLDDPDVRTHIECMEVNDSGVKIYAVKACTSPGNDYDMEMAYRAYVARKKGLCVQGVYIVHVNNQCVWPKKEDLFTISDRTAVVEGLQDRVENLIPVIQKTLRKPDVPKCEAGPHCDIGPCPFKMECWKQQGVEGIPVWKIPRITARRRMDLAEYGVKSVSDIRVEHFHCLTHKQSEWVNTIISQEIDIDRDSILKEISKWEFPIAMLDFETINEAIPVYEGTTPYEQVPFQFSVHMLHSDGRITHMGYLDCEKGDPRPRVAEKVVHALRSAKTVVAYYASFEKAVLTRLQEAHSEHAAEIKTILESMEDLYEVVKHYVKHYKFEGSYSIKKVLPALVPEMSYNGMVVANGIEAQRNYRAICNEEDPMKKSTLVKEGLDYCWKDTMAMIKILTAVM